MTELPEASRRLLDAVPGLDADIRFFPEGTKTAQDAADAIGCDVAAIVKSLVFVVLNSDRDDEPVVALVPGDRQLDTEALALVADGLGSRRATLDEVRDATGYAAGGTPPFGYPSVVRVFADESLRRNDPVWAAGGTPSTVFPISLEDLNTLAAPAWCQIT